jgi:hypothetical protein
VSVPAVLVFIDAGSHVADAEADDDAEPDEEVSSTGAPQAVSAATAEPARATANRRTEWLDDMRDPSISGPTEGWRGPLQQSM